MQAAETVYEFGSSPDEDEDNNGQKKSSSEKRNKQPSSLNASINSNATSVSQQQQPTRIAGTNLRANKTASTSIDQKLNTSFSSMSDSYSAANMAAPGNSSRNNNNSLHIQPHQRLTSSDISASEEQLLIKAETASSGHGADGDGGPGSMSNMSNTSLSSATNSSRGNISQSGGNQSGASVSSQKSLAGHQQSSLSSQQQNPNFDSNVISERVKNLATQIYQELKRIISRCNYDEDILSGLMPLIVRVLESLDLALIENQQLQVELELCKDDNDQLVIMFDKEKAAKRAIDKKLIESEYAYEEERQQYQQKIESLDNVVKMYELKAKNASDQATRFEEKEAERKKEYNKLHDRYSELLKSHCDIVERFRQLAGSSEIANLNVPHQMVASSSDLSAGELHPHPLNKLKLSHDDEFQDKNTASIRPRETLKTWNADTELTLEDASLVVIDDMVEASSQLSKAVAGDGSSHNESDRATSEPSGEGDHEKESENDSIAYTSMEKEFRKLIQENKDLLNTKNALNVVKDDLIAEVDRLTNEVSMYEQAVEQLNSTKDQMKHKVSSLDAELRKTKEELEKAKQKIRESNEEGVPYSQRKRFGRAEMAKVLMERNNYKERFMELQDAVRYTELVRANRIETEKRSGLWKFFSNLFGAPPPPTTRAILGAPRDSGPVVAYNNTTGGTSAVGLADRAAGAGSQMVAADALQVSASGRGSTGSIWSANQRLSGAGGDCIVLMDSDGASRASGARDSGGAGASAGSDAAGYIHAYGWSLRASSIKGLASDNSNSNLQASSSSGGGGGSGGSSSRVSPILGGTSSHNADPSQSSESITFNTKLAGLQVPIPQYCRPLTGDSLGMKIWCATAIDQSGGDLSKCARRIVDVPADQDTSTTLTDGADADDADTSGSLVNISTSTPVKSPPGANRRALRELEQDVNQALIESEQASQSSLSRLPLLKTTTEVVLSALPFADDDMEELSSMVWICSTQHSRSKITIIDIQSKPDELLDSFYVPTFLYCIKSIPGCKPSDLLGLSAGSMLGEDGRPFSPKSDDGTQNTTAASTTTAQGMTLSMINELITTQRDNFYKLIKVDPTAEQRLRRGRIEVDKMLREQVAASTSGASHEPNAGQSMSEAIIELAKGPDAQVAMAVVEKPQVAKSDDDAEISRLLENTVPDGMTTLQKLNDFVAHTQPQMSPETISAGDSKDAAAKSGQSDGHDASTSRADASYHEPISTHLPTVWMGGKDCVLYIHSAQAQWKDCVACVQLPDSILQICHYRGRAFVALADGSLCVFFRNIDTKQWDFSQYLLINIGLMSEATSDSLVANFEDSGDSTSMDTHSRLANLILEDDNRSASHEFVGGSQSPAHQSRSEQSSPSKTPSSPGGGGGKRPATPNSSSKRRGKVSGVHCLEIANKNLWLGHRNRVLIFDPITMRLRHTFNVVPQVDNQIRQMVSMKDGVFICLRSDLTLRLYSSLRPYQHIQNIDIEPVVTRLISPKTFVISHITSMRVAENSLWIGIAHGMVLTIPCKLVPQISEAPMRNSLTGKFEESPSHLSIARFVPKCDINNAQVSFHGHRDAVKFFIHAYNFMLSGGQGYLDFRHDLDDQSKTISDKSHLILWQLPN